MRLCAFRSTGAVVGVQAGSGTQKIGRGGGCQREGTLPWPCSFSARSLPCAPLSGKQTQGEHRAPPDLGADSAEEGGRWAVPRAQPAAKPVLLEWRETWPGAFSSRKLKSLSRRWRTGWVALELTTVEVTPSFVRLLQQNVSLGNLF